MAICQGFQNGMNMSNHKMKTFMILHYINFRSLAGIFHERKQYHTNPSKQRDLKTRQGPATSDKKVQLRGTQLKSLQRPLLHSC